MSTAEQLRDAGARLALDAEINKFHLAWAITKAARSFPRFTSDEVRDILAEIGVHELEHPNALGGAFLVAARAGVIENMGRVRKSQRTGAHRRAVAIWRSMIFQAPWPADGPNPAEEGDQ